MVKPKYKPSIISQDSSAILRNLILFNDEINTFDFVIQSLIEVCDHEPEQAEQCAMIAHFKGKCSVKAGDYTEIKPLGDQMVLRGLTVSIE
ncbi:MAG: ATP-dependent Clp protease adaptor ClpS [Bacteroidota bacterium]